MEFEMFIPTKVLFGVGKIKSLHKEQMPGQRALIVISNGKSTKSQGYLDTVINELHLKQCETVVYDGIEANPTSENIDLGAEICQSNHCDFIVAIGGGSVIDSAKMIVIVSENGGKIWDYTNCSNNQRAIINNPLPIIAITTTSGTGSEIDCAGAFTYLPTHEKVALKDERLFPVITIIDPELMLSVPSKLTAYQGWDALTHSMENFINKNTHVMSSLFAKQSMSYAGEYLSQAVNQGQDIEAREKMAMVSYLSGMVIHMSGTSSMHALECAMSALHPTLPHGAGLIMLSVAYFQFFIDQHVCDDQFIEMARLLGYKEANQANDFIKVIQEIHKRCHVDQLKMSDYGITQAEFSMIIDNARKTMGSNFDQDRYKLSDSECLYILNQAYL